MLNFLVGLGVPEKFAKWVAYAILAIVILLLLWAAKCHYDHKVISNYQNAVQSRAAPATDQAAVERSNDNIVTTQHEEELHNAIAAQPDQPISPSSHALACQRLHDAGRHPASCR